MATSLPVTIYQLPKPQIDLIPIKNGNLLFETDQGDNGKIYLDKDGSRIQIGGNFLPVYEVDFPSSGWTSVAPFTQTVSVSGITSDFNSIPTLNQGGATSESNQRTMQLNFNYILYYDLDNGTITATAPFTKPNINLKVNFVGQ